MFTLWPLWGEAENPFPELCSLWRECLRSWKPLLPLLNIQWHPVGWAQSFLGEVPSFGIYLKLICPSRKSWESQPGVWFGPGHQGCILINPETAQLAKSSELNSCLQWKGPSELVIPHLKSVLDGVEIPGGSSWISCMAYPLPATLREVNPWRQPRDYRTAAVTLSWLRVTLQSPDCSWNIACSFQLRVFWDSVIDCSCGGFFEKTLLFQPSIKGKKKKSVKLANVKSRICSFSVVFCLKDITEHFQYNHNGI